MKNILAFVILVIVSLPCASHGRQLKVATLAPAGSIWARQFDAFNREVREKTGNAVSCKIYYGGVMGDDRVMYRKMRIGQLQGAGFTVTGLAEIVPDFRLLSIPFLFNDYDEVDMAWREMTPLFQRQFAQKGLDLVATTEVGFVYTMSTRPVADAAAMRATRCWVPTGDPLSRIFLEEAGISPTPLALPDVLTSLQTGLIQTVFNGYYGAIVLQWFTKTGYMSDIPFGYAYGGLVFSNKAFKGLTPDQIAIIREAAARHLGDSLRRQTRQSNASSLTTLQREGMRIVTTTPASRRQFLDFRDRTIERASGRLFSETAYRRLAAALERYRKTAGP